MKAMTIREIAEPCEAGESTIKDWVRTATESGAAATMTGAGLRFEAGYEAMEAAR